MKNKTAKQIYRDFKIKCILIGALYAAALALILFWVMTINTFLGIAATVVLAVSVKAPFDKLVEKDLESIIYEDLDPDKFNELLALGAFKRSTRHKVLGAMCAGDYDKTLELTEASESKTMDPIEKCNNLYRRGAIYFERGEFEKLPEIVKGFNRLKKESSPKISYVFNNYTVFDKFDAFADDDFEYVIDVCDIDLKEINPKKQNHNMTRINVSFYRAVSLYKLERFEEAKKGFEDIIAFAPKMHKAKLSQNYIKLIDKEK